MLEKPDKTIVVIGGAQGGPVAAARAREFAEHARIILIEKASHVSWVQAGLRHHLQGEVVGLDDLDRARQSFFERRYRIDVRTNTTAVGLDNDARRVVVETANGTDRIPYDAVIFAGGARTPVPDVDGLAGEGVVTFRTLEDLRAIEVAISSGAKSAAVLGAGGFGLDAALGLRAAGLAVTVIERESRVLPGFSLPAARAAARALRATGVDVISGESLVGAEPFNKRGRTLRLSSGKTVDADIVVVATGMVPRSQLLRDAGASVHKDGTIRVDRHMQTSLHRVYACGTAVSVPHTVTGAPTWLVQDAIINRTAQIAGRSAAVGPEGVREELAPVAGTSLHHVGKVFFARTGISDAAARSAFGDERVGVSTIHSSSSEAWLNGEDLTVRLVVDRATNAVVGGEVWGGVGVPRRIDLIAAAVLERWSPARLAGFDLAYNAALGPAHDPLNVVGSVASMTLDGETRAIDAEVLALRLARGDDITLIDLGTSDARLRRMLPASTVAIPLEELRDRVDSLDKSKTTVLLSRTGRRAHLGARILKQRGFDSVLFLDGGAITWDLMHAE
jgi:NADPH-dependent 2,4-dienoyl-CoA reductase/sulfur reductase-like enzyme/rhodanese-related sulfurtransferase